MYRRRSLNCQKSLANCLDSCLNDMNCILEHALFRFQFLIKVGQWAHLGNLSISVMYFYNIYSLTNLLKWNVVTICFLLLYFLAVQDISSSLMTPLILLSTEVLAELSSFKMILKHLRATENHITIHTELNSQNKRLSSLPSISQTRVHCSHHPYSNHFKVLLTVFLESPFVSRSQNISKTSDFLSFSFNRARNVCIVCTVTVTAQVSGVSMQEKDDY